MCFKVNHQYCCYFIGVLAMILGFLEVAFKSEQIADSNWKMNSYWNSILLACVISWVMIMLGAVILIVGAFLKDRRLLLVWIIVALVFGVGLIILKIVIFTCFLFKHNEETHQLLFGSLTIVNILLVFLFVYYPYAYRHELEDEQYE
ncbi:uncharacterized protein LOC122817733 isoform X1 [Drosophila biarmipes]|uniref:uncharacterized protein LOC122817733 isoform X1 n=2 Tax=Drosophila biarmipes TaxID=125945 RepID=UPI0007E8B199|nr:uncharacterized protein LOC122817733 isoform X1 [Drosophila biarmipes]